MQELTPQAIALLNSLAAGLNSEWLSDPIVVYCNPQHPSGLWSIKKGDIYVDAPSSRLRGRISRLWHRRYDETSIRWFLQVDTANQQYIIQSAHGRVFSRTMLAAIALMTVEQAQRDVTVECKAWQAQEGPTQFCSLYVDGLGQINAPKIENADLGKIARAAQSVVAEANGYTYTAGEESR